MRVHRSQRRKLVAEINVVPYIDVMLVLLVIFMITTPLLSQGVKVSLPQAAAKAIDTESDLPIVLSINSEGKYFLNIGDEKDTALDAQTVATTVAAALKLSEEKGATPRQVLVKGDQYVDYGKVVQGMVLLQKAGADSVGLMTTPQADTTEPPP
jgi:biopolymer transport protein TolR